MSIKTQKPVTAEEITDLAFAVRDEYLAEDIDPIIREWLKNRNIEVED